VVWKVSIGRQTIHHTAVPNVENKSVGWDDFLTSLFQIIIGVKMINHKISAIDLYICVDTLQQSLRFSNWSGGITPEGRQRVMEKLQDIMYDMSVEIITDKANFTIDADAGI